MKKVRVVIVAHHSNDDPIDWWLTEDGDIMDIEEIREILDEQAAERLMDMESDTDWDIYAEIIDDEDDEDLEPVHGVLL